MPGLVGQYPKTLIYMRAAAAAANAAASDSSLSSLISGLKAIPWCVGGHGRVFGHEFGVRGAERLLC